MIVSVLKTPSGAAHCKLPIHFIHRISLSHVSCKYKLLHSSTTVLLAVGLHSALRVVLVTVAAGGLQPMIRIRPCRSTAQYELYSPLTQRSFHAPLSVKSLLRPCECRTQPPMWLSKLCPSRLEYLACAMKRLARGVGVVIWRNCIMPAA